MTKDSRAKGQVVELWAKDFLTQNKLTYITSNYHSRFGEIDLIFMDNKRKPSSIVFVEVRYRKQQRFGSGAETVTISKQRKLIKTAQTFLQKETKYSTFNARFDVVSVSSVNDEFQADWHQNAFQASPW